MPCRFYVRPEIKVFLRCARQVPRERPLSAPDRAGVAPDDHSSAVDPRGRVGRKRAELVGARLLLSLPALAVGDPSGGFPE